LYIDGKPIHRLVASIYATYVEGEVRDFARETACGKNFVFSNQNLGTSIMPIGCIGITCCRGSRTNGYGYWSGSTSTLNINSKIGGIAIRIVIARISYKRSPISAVT